MIAQKVGLFIGAMSLSIMVLALWATSSTQLALIVVGFLGFLAYLTLVPDKPGPKDWPLPGERAERVAEVVQRSHSPVTRMWAQFAQLSIQEKLLLFGLVLLLDTVLWFALGVGRGTP